MHRLIRAIADGSNRFRHIDAERMLVSLTPARSKSSYGLHAKIIPMRFPGGRRSITRRGRSYQMPTITARGREILYIVYFCLPRFQDQSFNDKLSTVFHELYHISPKFNGDLRRFKGRNAVHGPSWKEYERKMSEYAEDYLATCTDSSVHGFLRFSYRELTDRYGQIVGLRVREPQHVEIVRSSE